MYISFVRPSRRVRPVVAVPSSSSVFCPSVPSCPIVAVVVVLCPSVLCPSIPVRPVDVRPLSVRAVVRLIITYMTSRTKPIIPRCAHTSNVYGYEYEYI